MENGKANSGSNPKGRPPVVVVGSGFAGFTCAHERERGLRPEDAELVLASPTDYLLYSPLLPEVATGVIDPRHIVVPLHGVLKRTRVILGDTAGVDLDARTCAVRPPNAQERVLGLDRLVLAPGGITREPMEVAPTSHYSMGGVVVEPETHATDVAGLYAAGEVAAGLPGANRLGGNSLSETVIFGCRAGEAAAAFSRATEFQPRSRQKIQAASDEIHSYIKEDEEFTRPLQRALRNAMREGCGVVRAEQGLREALTKLDEIKKAAGDVDARPDSGGYGDLAHALDLRASLITAEASLLGATQRRESRGAHQRSDHPHLDPSMKMNLVISKHPDGRLHVSGEPVPPVPAYLRAWAEGDDEVEVARRLLE